MSAEERWAAFFCYSAEKGKRKLVNAILEIEEAIAMAGETMLDFTKEEVEWFRRESEIKYELDMRQMLSDAQDEARREGHEEGRKAGHKKGRAEGRKEGHKNGLEKGRREGLKEAMEKAYHQKLESARKMKARGDSDEEIAGILSLPVKDIAAL
jgi:flagellar biosynthesis/type III secretory pathway protein FliH